MLLVFVAGARPLRPICHRLDYRVSLVTVFGRNDTRSFRCVPDEIDVTDEVGPTPSQPGCCQQRP